MTRSRTLNARPRQDVLLFGSGGIISQDRFIRSLNFLYHPKTTLPQSIYKKALSFLRANRLDYRSLTVQLLFDIDYAFSQIGFGLNLVCNFIYSVHHSRMIATTQHLTDHWQRCISFFAHEVHGDLSRLSNLLGTITSKQGFDGCLL